MGKRTTKAELEKMLHANDIALKEYIAQVKDLKSDLSMSDHRLKQANLIVIDNDKRHELAIAKRDDYVKRVLARIEGVKALLHIPVKPHDVNFMNNPGMEQLKDGWNKVPQTVIDRFRG